MVPVLKKGSKIKDLLKTHYIWSVKYTKLVNHCKKHVLIEDPILRDYFVFS